jgi:O-antigen ligase
VLWFSGRRRGRRTVIVVGIAGAVLLLTHTRTALVAMIVGLVFAGLSLIVAESRVRKLFAYTAAVIAITAVTASSLITSWLTRGQGTQQLTSLTGRTDFWGPVLAFPRNKFQEIFGFGLSNGQFRGLPIDSNWLESYQEFGFFGVAVCAAILVFLIVSAYFQPRGVQRALALFLAMYCLVASFTEVGITDVTPYLLDVTVAASLLMPMVADKRAR